MLAYAAHRRSQRRLSSSALGLIIGVAADDQTERGRTEPTLAPPMGGIGEHDNLLLKTSR